MKWDRLETLAQLDELHQASQHRPVVIFKHSTRCSISAFAKHRFEQGWEESDEVSVWLLDLLRFREVSNEVAVRYGVPHESPQVIVLAGGKAIYDASHMDIDPQVVRSHVEHALTS